MGYAWRGVCYADSTAALNAFSASVPSSDASGVVSLSSATVDGTGRISYSVSVRSFASASSVAVADVVQLPVCDVPSMDQFSVQSWLVPALFVFAAFMGYRTGFRP